MSPTNPELVRAMQAVANSDTPENRKNLYAAFLDCTLLVPVANPFDGKPAGFQPVEGETPVEFVVTHDDQDRIVMFAFTDEESLKAWKAERPSFIASAGKNLFQMALDMQVASIVVNIAGPVVGGELTHAEFHALAAGILPSTRGQISIPAGARIAFGAPDPKPSPALVAALREACAQQTDIAASYLFEVQVNQGDPHLVAGVRFGKTVNDRRIEEILGQVGESVSVHLAEHAFIDFMVLGREDTPEIVLTPEMLVFARA